MKRLYKSQTNKVLSGLLGGLGDYWNIDPVILRVGFIFLTCFSGVFPGIIAYFIGSLIVPNSPSVKHEHVEKNEPSNTKEENHGK